MLANQQFDERFLAFGAEVIRILPMLPHNQVGAHIADQLFRSATSVGAHLQESRAAESRADFIHKLQMALKEMREAKYWLTLTRRSEIMKVDITNSLFKESGELVAILSQSVITAKGRYRTPKPLPHALKSVSS